MMLFHQLLVLFETVHARNLIHRDIKPANFLMGLGDKSGIVHMVDYGLVNKYRSNTTGEHIGFRKNKCLIGTAQYASINAHKGIELTRRDDLQALGYLILYLYRGTLPWKGATRNKNSDYFKRVLHVKETMSPNELCVDCPQEFSVYFSYVQGMTFAQDPDFKFLKVLVENIASREKIDLFDNCFDWNIKLATAEGKEIPRCSTPREVNP